MKTAFIFGEFITKSTTGIAYINTNLKSALKELNFLVSTLDDPRSNDYLKSKGLVKRNKNILIFIKLIIYITFSKKYNIAFLTISMGNLGLLKSLLIISILKLKTEELYLYIHRGDLEFHYNQSIYKRFLIILHLVYSSKIIVLSKLFTMDKSLRIFQKKVLIIPNSLSKEDSSISNNFFKKRNKILEEKYHQKIIKFIYSGNLQRAKGIHNIIKAIKIINQKKLNSLVQLDIYGMKFEEVDCADKNIVYKGKLNNANRLDVMSNYDFLITASKTEGLPITLIESMAIGLPFITTNVGAIDDLLIDNYPYITQIETSSIVEITELAIKDQLGDRKKIKAIMKSNKDLFDKQFNYSQFFNTLKKNINI